MKKKYIKLLVIILPLLVITPLTFSNKEVKKEKEIAIKEPSLPGGIVAYTLNGENTELSYSELLDGYEINKITCKNGTIATYDSDSNSVNLSSIHMPDYCVMDFKEQSKTLYKKILADNPNRSTRTDFSTIFNSATTGTLYTATEKNVHNTSDTTVYYYASKTTNNWVKFANFYWRIIRTNADGSIRLLYHGTSPDATNAYIGTSSFNGTYNNSMYVGYMYGTSGSQASNRTNKNSSTIKKAIDTWYLSNLNSYSKYLSTEAVYCSDRSVGYGNYSSSGSTFYYSARVRVNTNYAPTYDCTTAEDAFSGSNESAKLTYPIGLMTADEVSYAGGKFYSENTSTWYFLNSTEGSSAGNTAWWLMSPDIWYNSNSYAFFIYGQSNNGQFNTGSVGNTFAIRPVISLKGNLTWKSGDGSSSSPYEVKDLPPTTLYDEILADNPNISTNTDFSTVITDINTGTLYKETESIAGSEAKDVYYFAGRAQNNWVKFGDIYWRIIRTNHDGSVRLLYAGKTLTSSSLECVDVGNYNTNYTNSMYVGYMYGPSGSLESNRTNTNNSTIKNFLDTWYTNNLNNYTNYISKDAVYCNDRDIGSGTYVTIGTSFKFAPYTRVINNKKPSYNCNNTKDAFSGNNSEAKLTYPISLMTLDEIMFAGGNSYTTRHNAWYMLNSSNSSYGVSGSFWLLSPAEGPGSFASVFVIDRTTGSIGTSNVENNLGIRPVISIKSDALWSSGNGSSSSPYEIVYN